MKLNESDILELLKEDSPSRVFGLSLLPKNLGEDDFYAQSIDKMSYKFNYRENIKSFSDSRSKEFLMGRFCAHQALKKFIPYERQVKIEANEDRSPLWPKFSGHSIKGSLSHNESLVCALVVAGVRGLGIDLESRGRLNERLASKVVFDEDLSYESLEDLPWSREDYFTFIFSAKEALYKTLYPQVEKFFGFSEAYISSFDFGRRTFEISIHPDSFLAQWEGIDQKFKGRFLESDDEVLTIIIWD